MEYSTIFVELDALLDTRLAILANLNDEDLIKILKADYQHRPMDVFPGVNDDEFKELYKNRDKYILKNAIITPIGRLLREFSEKTLNQVLNTPFHYAPKVILNVHPYKLNDDEVSTIVTALRAVTNDLCDIEITNLPYEEITPAYVKRNISLLILYEYYKWLEVHSSNGMFNKITCPEVSMMGPAIYFKKITKEILQSDENPFEAIELLASPLIGLKLLSIDNFSAAYRTVKE